jgi:Uma2 family endonuclease
VANIPLKCIEVFRDPHEGTYQTLQSFRSGESVTPLAFPDVELGVSLLFGG